MRNRHHRRRRNPSIGSAFSTGNLTFVGGGLVGVTAAKAIPPLLPAMLTSTAILRVVSTAGSAFLASFLATKFNPRFGEGVFFGGLMQTLSVALNSFIPSVGSRIGLGELLPGSFPVPQNPIRAANSMMAAPGVGRVDMNGIRRAFGVAL